MRAIALLLALSPGGLVLLKQAPISLRRNGEAMPASVPVDALHLPIPFSAGTQSPGARELAVRKLFRLSGGNCYALFAVILGR